VTVAWIDTPADLEIALFQALIELKSNLPTRKYPNRLRQLRFGRYTQQEIAARMGVSLATYRTWEYGERLPQPRHMRAICEALDVQQHELGFALPTDVGPVPEPAPSPGRALLGTSVELPAAIQSSQDEWRQIRRYLAANAAALTRAAANLYPRTMKVGPTALLTRDDWLTTEPVDVRDVQLEWLDGPQRKVVKGTEAEARLVVPLRAPGHQYESYTAAVRYLDRPTLFENRPTYRLLDASVADRGATLAFSLATYFEMIDVSQAVAHELAAAQMRGVTVASLGQLPFRSLIADPFDVHRRPVQAAIDAVTIRQDARAGTASFYLHWRDPAKVAVGGGLYSVMPIGVFQPSTVDPWGQRLDFDMWRNVVREFSEEFLGMPEHDGSAGARIDYDMWPLYRTLTSAREAGSLRFRCFGLGVDPLGLGIDILTAVVIDSEVFDDVFGDRVQVNAEGHIVADDSTGATMGFPFTEESIHRFVRDEPMGPGGAACLAMAWRHREALALS
jgi:transcriptional regulator with XRE-family HTH domain